MCSLYAAYMSRSTRTRSSSVGCSRLVAARSSRRALRSTSGSRSTPQQLFYASSLICMGVSPKVVSERLGHSSIDTTMNVCARLWPGEDERTRAVMNDVLRRDRAGVRDQRGTGLIVGS